MQPLYIHGSLKENYMIIGIAALEQFADESMRNNIRLKRHCVKSFVNAEYGFPDKESQYEKIIAASDIIYAYGISFGETDKQRWQILRTWLDAKSTHKLVIFKYDTGFDKLDGMYKGLLLDKIDEAKDEYLRILGYEEDNLGGKYSQIYVADSSKVLRFKLTRKERELTTV